MNEAIIAALAAGIGAILTGLGKLIVDTIKAKKEKTGDLELQYQHQEKLIELTVGLRNDLEKNFVEINEKLEDLNSKVNDMGIEQRSTSIVSLRHSITQTWELYKEKEEIPNEVYESTLSLYDVYKEIGGNSYIDTIIDEMKKWRKI